MLRLLGDSCHVSLTASRDGELRPRMRWTGRCRADAVGEKEEVNVSHTWAGFRSALGLRY